MKKFISILMGVTLIFSLTACGGSANPPANSDSASAAGETQESELPESEPPQTEDSTDIPVESGEETNILVTYFSMPETTDPSNMTQDEDNSVVVIDGEVLGNTQYVAYLIQEFTGSDIFRIEPETPYPTDHEALVDLADREQASNARPALAASVENIDQYDVIFIGYPNWWADMPMILYTFLESHDLSGKTIIPFNTHGGSGFSETISTMAELAPNAAVERNGFTVSRNSVENCQGDVEEWLRELDIKQ